MEANEILIALTNLESNLNEINTAKQQVEETVTAYKSIYPHINAYVGELGKVSEGLLDIISEIKSNVSNLNDRSKQILFKLSEESQLISAEYKSSCATTTENFKAHTSNIISEIKSNANNLTDGAKQILFKLSEESQLISAEHKSSCATTTENFKAHTSNIISEIKSNANNLTDGAKQILFKLSEESQLISAEHKSSCATTTENFKAYTSNIIFDLRETLNKISSDFDAYIIKLQNYINDLYTLEKNIKNATELVSELKNDICILNKELKESQNEQNKQLQKLIDNIEKNQKDQDNNLETIKHIASIIQINQEKLNKVLASQDGKIEQLLNSQKTNKKLTTIILLIVLITLASMFLLRYYLK